MAEGSDRDGWRRIDDVLERALELSGEERDRFLEMACAGDPALRREVEVLLRAAESAEEEGFLGRPAEVTWEAMVERLASERTELAGRRPGGRLGNRIGPYRVEEEIGAGGMATVYRARRADGAFEQEVALKVIAPGLAVDRLIQRFAAERQILADLAHPGIARLLDGGTTDDGLPYLVMEHVEGEPLTDHCDRNGLGVDERLRLFLQVLDAVDHAHRNLVLHRDLKPSNILVTPEGEVKLLDFGIAKILDPATGAGEPTLTLPGLRPLTPDCASPEQIRGEPLTTASDVYQLGVLLYRLLAGRPPYRLEATTASGLERAIEQTDPEAPSEVVSPVPSEDGSEREDFSSPRGMPPERLRRRLRGDLDTITLKAIRKEPERRYASVESLAADLRRHLEGRPVSARPDGWGYRTRKFLGRHPWLGPVAALVLLLVGGYVWTLDRHAADLERERNAARVEAARATQMRDFLVTVFEGSDPTQTLGDTVTARTLLERGARRADSVLADQPELRAEMLGVIGRVMKNLGFYDRAVPVLERAVGVRRQLDGSRSPPVAGVLLNLGDAHVGSRDFHSDYASAERYYREAAEMYRATPASSDSMLARALRGVAVSVQRHGLDSTKRYVEEALEVAAVDPGRQSAMYASLLGEKARALRYEGRYGEAGRLYQEALDRLRAIHGERHAGTLDLITELAKVSIFAGDTAESVRRFRESLALHRKIYGRGHPETLMVAGNLSGVLSRLGRRDESLDLARSNVKAAEQRWPRGHVLVAFWQITLGMALCSRDRPEEGAEALRRAKEVLTDIPPKEGPNVAHAWYSLGVALLYTGAPDALAWIRETRVRLARLSPALRSKVPPAFLERLAARLDEEGYAEEASRWRALLPE